MNLKPRHERTLRLLFSKPTPAGIKWLDMIALLDALGAEITEAKGSRVLIILFSEAKVLHRPHPSTDLDKGAVALIRNWLDDQGVHP